MERQIHSGVRPLIGLTRYGSGEKPKREVDLVRTPTAKKRLQVSRLKEFKQRNAAKAQQALDRLGAVVDGGGNTFEELSKTVEVCSLGQITERLQRHAGKFRPLV